MKRGLDDVEERFYVLTTSWSGQYKSTIRFFGMKRVELYWKDICIWFYGAKTFLPTILLECRHTKLLLADNWQSASFKSRMALYTVCRSNWSFPTAFVWGEKTPTVPRTPTRWKQIGRIHRQTTQKLSKPSYRPGIYLTSVPPGIWRYRIWIPYTSILVNFRYETVEWLRKINAPGHLL